MRTIGRITNSRAAVVVVGLAFALGGARAHAAPKHAEASRDKVPITTASDDARALYLEGRDLLEKLRITDAHARFESAVAKDKDFALGHVGLANTAPTTKDFFAALDHAVALADKVSEPERMIIKGLEAGATGHPSTQKELYTKLVKAYPRDERALALLGGFYFGQQDYAKAIDAYTRAIAVNPRFSSPYNLLGYSYRTVEKYADAEATFKKYIELIPDDPNPYDSYAELLMKIGRFDDAIKNYEKALAIDGNFISAYIGIANNHMFSGRGEDARKALARLTRVARNDGERRQALAWTAESFIHEGAWDKALAEIDKMIALSDQAHDLGQKANDLNFKANTLLEADRADDAAAAFKAQVDASAQANQPDDVKETTRRNALFNEGRVALAKHDLAGAKARAQAYEKAVAVKQIPFEVRQQHELAGLIALADGKPKVAAAELAKANQQDPRVLYHLAVALLSAGDAAKARATAKKAFDFNGLSLNYGYVRAKAKGLLKT
jgi:tetratricopeptide (TPR) repeat protein